MTKREVYKIESKKITKLRIRLPTDFYLHTCATVGDRVWSMSPGNFIKDYWMDYNQLCSVRRGKYVISMDGVMTRYQTENELETGHSNGALVELFGTHLLMIGGGRPKTTSTEIMDTRDKTWKFGSNILEGVAGHQAVRVGNFVYVTGGYNDNIRLVPIDGKK